MRRVLPLVVLAAWFAVHPVMAQDAKRQIRSVEAAQKASKARAVSPEALRRDSAPSRSALTKWSRDPRPLQRLDNSHIPRYASVEAFRAASAPTDLRARATVVGKAEGVRRPVSKGLTQGAPGAARTSAGLSMGERLRLERAPNGTVRWMQGRLGRAAIPPGAAGKQAAYTQAALTIAEAYARVLRLDDPATELRPMQTTLDDLGYVHARFEQTYAGLPVWGRDLYVHLDAQGEVYAVNGTYEPTPVGVVTTPTLDEAAALQTVVADLEARGRWAPLPDDVAAWLGVEEATMERVLYPDPEQGMRLAYDVSLHPNLLEWYTYLVDARSGQILDRIARHCTLHYHPASSAPVRVSGLTLPEPAVSSARGDFFDGSATDLNGQTQNLRVYQHDDGVFYNVWDLPNLNVAASDLPNEPDGGAMTISANETDFDDDINLTHVTSGDNTWDDPVSVSAHVNMNIVYTYYKDTHDRDAIDGKDQSMISIIHVTDEGRPMDNAFWNGRYMAYGDGEQAFLPLAGALDVAAHEVTHGVIENTANLLYQSQSGALNESFADVFGVMIDPEDFLLGEDIMKPGVATALRDLLNPGNPQVLSRQPSHMSDFRNLSLDDDNGGVHVNSGIPNRAAALIIGRIDFDDAERIYYRALTTYLTRNSQFGDARNALEQSALDLFGEGSSQVVAVQQSFDDVGILSATDTGGDEGNDLPPQTGGESLIAFMLEDGAIGLLNLTDPDNPTWSLFGDPAVARVDAEGGERSQLSTPLNGETIYFINADGKLAVLQVASGIVSVFEDLFISEEGDLRNASVSPTEDFVAIVSTHDNDPTLYIFDGAQLFAIDLKPETTQQGVLDETIQFPDVVSWSPNPQLPRIVFDALNQVDFVGETTISYWSIYEIDFGAQTILNLIPAQPTDISIGNITYSNTNPDRVAFNTIDETGTWDILIGDFETGEVEALGLPGLSFDGEAITDGQRPTFAPDDTGLAFSSPKLGLLFVYSDQDPPTLTPYILPETFGSPAYNPRWFVRGGSGGTGNEAPTAGFNASTASGQAPLLVAFDASSSSDPNGDPLTYRWDFGDGSIGSGQTTSHTFVSGGAVTVTLTVTDSGGLSGTSTQQITVEGSAANVITLRNFDPQQAQTVLLVDNDGGFVFGTNRFEDQAKAMAFTLPAGVPEARVAEVNVWFGFKRAASTLDYAIEILDGTPTSGPTTSLGREVFPLSGVHADEDPNTDETQTKHALSQPVRVGPSFFVSVDFGSYGQGDYVSASLVTSPLLGSRVPEVWEKWSDGSWNTLSDSWNFGAGLGTDGANLWIEVVAQTAATGTPVEEAGEIPHALALSSNYPNPFRSATTLRFELPARTEVDLRVVDLLGRTVARLIEGSMEAGVHTVRFEAGSLPSGVYLARLRAGATTHTRTLVLLR